MKLCPRPQATDREVVCMLTGADWGWPAMPSVWGQDCGALRQLKGRSMETHGFNFSIYATKASTRNRSKFKMWSMVLYWMFIALASWWKQTTRSQGLSVVAKQVASRRTCLLQKHGEGTSCPYPPKYNRKEVFSRFRKDMDEHTRPLYSRDTNRTFQEKIIFLVSFLTVTPTTCGVEKDRAERWGQPNCVLSATNDLKKEGERKNKRKFIRKHMLNSH